MMEQTLEDLVYWQEGDAEKYAMARAAFEQGDLDYAQIYQKEARVDSYITRKYITLAMEQRRLDDLSI